MVSVSCKNFQFNLIVIVTKYLFTNKGISNVCIEIPYKYYRVLWLNIVTYVNPHSASAFGKGIDILMGLKSHKRKVRIDVYLLFRLQTGLQAKRCVETLLFSILSEMVNSSSPIFRWRKLAFEENLLTFRSM